MQKAASLFTSYIIVFLFSTSNRINPGGSSQQVSWQWFTKINFWLCMSWRDTRFENEKKKKILSITYDINLMLIFVFPKYHSLLAEVSPYWPY